MMNPSLTKVQCMAVGAVLVMVSALVAVATSGAQGQEGGVEVPVRVEKLANAPGKTLTVVTVNFAPGAKSGAHHHAGNSVFAYVLSGAICSENSATGPVRVYKAGESFFESPGSRHLVSENASTMEPASVLAVFVADDGAQLTPFDK
jgi:quercetin dioxygenase-like cupin family protein